MNRALRHLFGPVVVFSIAVVGIASSLGFSPPPQVPTVRVLASPANQAPELAALRENQLKDYKAGLAKLDGNISLQALFILVTVLLIARKSDSLTGC